MAMILYQNRKRLYSGTTSNSGYSRSIRPYTGPTAMMRGYARGNALSQPSRGYRRGRGYRDPFSVTQNTRTHPVYPRPEVKWIDVTVGTAGSPLSIDNAGTANQNINSIPAGTGTSQRIGNQIALKSVYYQYVLNFGTGAVPNVIRHILYWDRQSDIGLSAGSDLLSPSSGYVTAPMNLENRNRFVILADDRLTLSPNGDQIRIIDGFRKINQLTNYNTTNPLPQNGALNVLFCSDESTAANEPTVYGTWRVRYIDC